MILPPGITALDTWIPLRLVFLYSDYSIDFDLDPITHHDLNYFITAQ
jgi:hypothetical protein